MAKSGIWTLLGLLFVGLMMACSDDVEEARPSPQMIELTVAEKEIANQQQSFAFKLLAALYQQEEGKSDNLLISPFSVYCALGMLTNGAEGETKMELLRTLGQDSYETDALNAFICKMVQGLKTADPAVVFHTANSLWCDHSVVLKDEFVRLNREQYEAESFSIDFSDPSAADQINEWCSQQTQGKITEMIREVSKETIAYLLNAVYFRAQWKDPFKKDRTEEAPFYVAEGQTVDVPFMKEDLVASFNQNEWFSSIALAYSSGSYLMHLIVPAEQVTLLQVIEKISQPGYWSEQTKWNPMQVQVILPCFEVQATYDLMNVLRSVGISHAFDAKQAEFGALTDQDFYVSMVKHSSTLKVDEEGSEGAAVSLIGGTTAPLLKKAMLKADKPFLFLITENATGTILFAGKIGKP